MKRLGTQAAWLLSLAAGAALAGPVPIECEPPAPHARPAVTTPGHAIAIARWAWRIIYGKAVWRVVYSPQSVAQFEPYTATLSKGVWHVAGTIYRPELGHGPEAFVCASDGKAVAMGRDD